MNTANDYHFCPTCGEHFAVHNDDGSCIVEDEQALDAEAANGETK